MSRSLRLGGIVAGLILVVFGVGAIVIGLAGRSEVNTNIKREQIVGTPDMKPVAHRQEGQGGRAEERHAADVRVAGKAIANGGDAKCFASYMRIHALEATGGKTYAQMPQYATADGKGTTSRPRLPRTRRPASRRATRLARCGSARPRWARR